MTKTLTIGAMTFVSAFAAAQLPVSAFDYASTLNPYIDNNPPHVLPLEHRTGGSPTVLFGPTTYVSDTVGSVNKDVAEFAAPQFFRAWHGINGNGGGFYANLYTILLDIKFENPAIGLFASLFNTNADNRNDGDAFVRWDNDGSGNPVGRLGISGVYSGSLAPNAYSRIVVTVDCTARGGLDTVLTFYVDGVQVNQVTNASGLDGRWALYTWDDGDSDGDHVDILGDNNGDNGTGRISQVAFWGEVLSPAQVAALGPVGSSLGSAPEEVVPSSFVTTRGQVAGGNVASLGADDNDYLRHCKFLVPNLLVAPIEVQVNGTTTKASTTLVTAALTGKMANAGSFSHSVEQWNHVTAAYEDLATGVAGTSESTVTSSSATSGNHNQKIGAAGALRARYFVRRTGPSAVANFCYDADLFKWTVN